MKYSVVLPCVLALLGVAACGGDDDDPNKLRVVAITTQIGDFALNVGGDRVNLTVLLKPNQDAHDFEPSPSQIRAISEADLILRHGLGLDEFVDKALETSDATVAVVSDGVDTIEGDEVHEGEEEEDRDALGIDPHIWFSVENAKRMVENVRDALVAEDAANAQTYRDNAAKYLASLDALDSGLKTEVAKIPQACRKLVTNHDVLGYYAKAYGFQIVGAVIPSTSTNAQPSASGVADIVKQIRDEHVPAIFAEASVNPALIRQVAREANVKVVDDLYGDSLGASGGPGGTYTGMMRENTKKIVEALKDC